MSEVAREIVLAIEDDLLDRRGLRQELEQIDEETREAIRSTWIDKVDDILSSKGLGLDLP